MLNDGVLGVSVVLRCSVTCTGYPLAGISTLMNGNIMSTTPRRIGKYELQKLLGSGSTGEVWKSYDLQYRREVAIKIFHTDLQSDPNFMKCLLSKAQTLASLHHPN